MVTVTIDGHETILTFVSKDDAEKFAQGEHARLLANEKNASQGFVKPPTVFGRRRVAPRARHYGIGLPPRPVSIRRRPSAMRVAAKRSHWPVNSQ